MTTIDETMKKMAGKPEEWVENCRRCGGKLLTFKGIVAQAMFDGIGNNPLAGLCVECSCAGAIAERELNRSEEDEAAEENRRLELERRRERRFRSSGMAEAWRGRSLTQWETEGESQRAALAAAERFLREAMRPGGKPRSLFIAGGVGTGKTMLASCLTRDLHRQLVWVTWANMGQVLDELRESYGRRESAGAALAKYKRSAALVLDDLGKERPTEWATEQIFALINFRYEHDLPTIVTTNYGGERLVKRLTPPAVDGWADDTTAQAIVDRLREMCELVKLTGESWRGGAR